MVPTRLFPPFAALALCVQGSLAVAQAPASPDPAQGPDLAELSLEDLMEIEVSVASRHGEKLLDVPAAVYVLTGDELRRQGVTSVQEALRMVPGFHVARWRTQGWDVASRGFTGGLSELNQSFMNQLLLMVDGVSLYSPVMAGIWWPLLDIPIADIDRIEIIRGPAGTLWGTNAMNGVVNVITKHARDTQGTQLDATVRTDMASGDLHYGGKLGESSWFRAWMSSTYQAGIRGDRDGDWTMNSVGWRSDWDIDGTSRARVLGTFYAGEFGVSSDGDDDQPKVGGFLSGLYETGSGDDLQRLQASLWLDHQKLPDQFTSDFEQDVQTLDLEWTRRQALGTGDSLTLGLGGRVVQADLGSDNGYIDFDPEFQRIWSVRAFGQGEFEFESLDSKLVLGLQVEENDVDDLQVQPNVRWLWRAAKETSVWASVARAVRTPSIEERDIVQRFDPGDVPFFVGNSDYDAETLLAYEVGARTKVSERVSVDLTAFYNDYDNLQTFEEPPGQTLTYGNEGRAMARGFEAAVDFDLTDRWRMRGTYTYFMMDFEASSSSLLVDAIDARDGLIPENHASLRSYYDLGDKWELDGAIYYVDHLSYFDVDSYVRVDARLGWTPFEGTQFSIGVQNATDPEHPEAGSVEVERVLYISLRTSF
ncbi:MAG: TonB-dependent receptor [Planctomycetota bacterium]|nr:TonB-dependent receptor [Planctomycetota bacterium]